MIGGTDITNAKDRPFKKMSANVLLYTVCVYSMSVVIFTYSNMCDGGGIFLL